MGFIRPELFEALAAFDDAPDCTNVCKQDAVPADTLTPDGAVRELTPCEICQLKKKRNALFRLAMLRAAAFVKANNQMDIKGGKGLEKKRVARVTIELEFNHRIFHERKPNHQPRGASPAANFSVPMGVEYSRYDDGSTDRELAELNGFWPCI